MASIITTINTDSTSTLECLQKLGTLEKFDYLSNFIHKGNNPPEQPKLYTPHAMCVCLCVLHINRSGLNHTQKYTRSPIRYCTVRGLLDRNISEESLQSSNEGVKTKTRQKTTKRKERTTKTKKHQKGQDRIGGTKRRAGST